MLRYLISHMVQVKAKQDCRRIDTWAGALITDLAESQCALVEANVARIDFNKCGFNTMKKTSIQISNMEQRGEDLF